jgi:hypothetical protein
MSLKKLLAVIAPPESPLDEYDLTVVADPGKPDEYVLVPLGHPAVGELSCGGVQPCGIEVVAADRPPQIHFGASPGPRTRRLVYWWADWSRVAEEQRSRGTHTGPE